MKSAVKVSAKEREKQRFAFLNPANHKERRNLKEQKKGWRPSLRMPYDNEFFVSPR